MKALLMLIAWSAATSTACAGQAVQVVQQQATAFVPASHVVTQFAVPVALPQTVTTVAPQSFIQYGTNTTTTPRSDLQSIERQIAELRAMLVEAAQSGAVTGLALPSLVRTHCAKCHGGADPKGGLDLSTLDRLTPQQRLKSIERMLSDEPKQRMPPPSAGAAITADDLGKLIQEFSNAPAAVKPLGAK